MSGCHKPIDNTNLKTADKCNCVFCLALRIDKLESYMHIEDKITSSDVLNRIIILENKINSIHKKPHKCPICGGEGYESYELSSNLIVFPGKECKSCEGKGIVWG